MFAEPCHCTGGGANAKGTFTSFTAVGRLGKKREGDVEERNEV